MISLFNWRNRRRAPDPFIMLRATVEASCKVPAVVLVSSVLPNDGTTATSAGLATALARSGSSTLTADGAKLCKKSRAELESLFAELRERHDFIIVDGCTFADGALMLAKLADGVLLTVRSGRRVVGADYDVTNLLERFGAKVIGVVETTAYGSAPALETTEVQSIARNAVVETLAS